MRRGSSKLEDIEARHPGFLQKVDAMFDAFVSIESVTAMIASEYGEHLSHTTVWKYKQQVWRARRNREQEARAAQTAWQELRSEGSI